MTTPRVGRNLLATSLIVSVLTACGGGGGGGSSPTPPPSGGSPSPAPVPAPAPAPAPAPSPGGTPVPPPGPGVTAGDTFGVTSNNRLVTYNRASPALMTAVAITGLQSAETVVGIDIRAGGATPGQLYALGSTGRLYTVDTTSGAATATAALVGDPTDTSDPFTALSGTSFGVDFDDATDTLRVVSDNGQNLRINVDTGMVITDTPLSRTGVTGAAYTNAFAAACRSQAYYIDTNTDELLTASDANGGALTIVGPLGVDATAAGDLEIATDANGNTGYAVLVVGGAATSYQINLQSGTAATAGPVTNLDSGELLRDSAISPPVTAPSQGPGDVFALTESGKLLSFNSASPSKACTSATFTGQAAGEKIVGIDVRPADQMMYALGSTGHLYTVDEASGALTAHSTLVAALGDVSAPYAGITGSAIGFDFNPGNDVARVTTDTGLNFRVAPDSGSVTTDVALSPVGSAAGEAAYSNNFAGVLTASYYAIDSATDSLQVLGRTSGNAINGDVSTVGPLGIGDVQSVSGFDIFGSNNLGLAALNIAGSTTSDLFSINLGSGAATRIGTIGGGERVSGLAYGRTPVAVVFGLTPDNHLVSFKATTPGTIDNDVAISGLAAGENVVGIDFRPADGLLYALTSAGHIYVLDTKSGAASGMITLTQNMNDVTSPVFTALSGTHFGIDFSSTVADGSLHVQSDTGQNLRVNLADGTVIADGAATVGGAPAQLFATALSNPYAGAQASQSYALDAATNSLVRQSSVSGAQTLMGALTVSGTPTTFQSVGGFDIAGGENGMPLVALEPTGATQSTLYRINLGNGALTPVGAIGTSTTVITDIAIRLQ